MQGRGLECISQFLALSYYISDLFSIFLEKAPVNDQGLLICPVRQYLIAVHIFPVNFRS
jgi:hypothetical protein